jgi:hypothetical protein
LNEAVGQLRARGAVVVQALDANEPIADGVDRELRLVDGRWQVVAVDQP